MPEPNQPLLETAMWLQQSLQTRALAVRTHVRAAKLLLHRLADIFTALAELASKSERTRRQWIDDPVLEIGARENVGPNDQILLLHRPTSRDGNSLLRSSTGVQAAGQNMMSWSASWGSKYSRLCNSSALQRTIVDPFTRDSAVTSRSFT
jgi:hypothetical protein